MYSFYSPGTVAQHCTWITFTMKWWCSFLTFFCIRRLVCCCIKMILTLCKSYFLYWLLCLGANQQEDKRKIAYSLDYQRPSQIRCHLRFTITQNSCAKHFFYCYSRAFLGDIEFDTEYNLVDNFWLYISLNLIVSYKLITSLKRPYSRVQQNSWP